MRLLLDLQVLQSESRTRGIGRYTRGLTGALLRNESFSSVSALLNLAVTQGLQKRLISPQSRSASPAPQGDLWSEHDALTAWLTLQRPSLSIHHFQGLRDIEGIVSPSEETLSVSDALYNAYLAAHPIDIVHQQSAFDGYGDNTVIGTNSRETGPARAITVYDLIPFEQPELYLSDPNRRDWYLRRLRALETADLLLTISEHTRRVVLSRLKVKAEQVINIGTDTDPIFRKRDISPARMDELLRRYKLQSPFLMHVGILEERKNVSTLIKAVGGLSSELKSFCKILLVADSTSAQQQSLRAIAKSNGVDPSALIFPGFVPDEDLCDLYGICAATIMPSFSEGFGLPVLEAMRCGAPVLASDCTSLTELVGNSELLFDPHRPEELSIKLNRLLTDDGFQRFAVAHSRQQEKHFSWQRSASTAYDAFCDTVARRNTATVANGPSRYVVLPPLRPNEADEDLKNIVSQAIDASSNRTQYANADQLIKQSDPKTEPSLAIGWDDRLVIVTASGELDLRQQTFLARMPGAMITSTRLIQNPPRELRYQIYGYSGLTTASARQDLEAHSICEPFSQLTGVFSPNIDFIACLEKSFNQHFSSIVATTLGQIPSVEAPYQAQVAAALFSNHRPPPSKPRLFVDISELSKNDAKSGIQRVVRNIVRELLKRENSYRVEPVFRDGDNYRYARSFTCKFLRADELRLPDSLVDFHPSDAFLGLDLDLEISKGAADRLREFRIRGGSVNFIVYDILPLLRPDWFVSYAATLFPNWLSFIAAASDGLIAISQTVAGELSEYLTANSADQNHRPEISWYHNGADMDAHFSGMPFVSEANLDKFESLFSGSATPIFLTVGTIEPRKGIQQLIDGAEYFWRQHKARFVLVGKLGWLVDELSKRIRSHPELGKQLFWFEHVSDEVLTALYRVATAVILPSEAEGFGLPLVEAVRHGVPIIARDIPVFREVAGSGAFYFRAQSGEDIGQALIDWTRLVQEGNAPDPTSVRVVDWKQSTDQLLSRLKGYRPAR